MHITPPVTAEGYGDSHHPRCAEWSSIVHCILNKRENATLLLLVKMAEKRILFEFLFCEIKCLTCSYHVRFTFFEQVKEKKMKFNICDFILFPKIK